jgi:hypothetical protein
MNNAELIHTEEFEGFTVNFYRLPEDDSPEGHFCTGDDERDAEIVARIESGEYDWFCARVTAERAGIVLASDFLGGCCYESASAFVTDDGYYPDMRRAAVDDAKAKIAELSTTYDANDLASKSQVERFR